VPAGVLLKQDMRPDEIRLELRALVGQLLPVSRPPAEERQVRCEDLALPSRTRSARCGDALAAGPRTPAEPDMPPRRG
jgi:hypothetical protein